MTTAGIDVGSVAAKAVVFGDGSEWARKKGGLMSARPQLLGRAMTPTGADPKQAAETAFAKALAAAGAARATVSHAVLTGYGRRACGTAAPGCQYEIVTEISAAARGAWWLGAPWGPVRTVADLGGQDTKVIVLDDEGNVADFAMNDKCAAGTGRFLSLMAACLELDLSELDAVAARSQAPVPLNATCAVFAESEVISLIAQGKKKEDIVAGLHAAIASRIAAMVRQMGGREVFFCGGGARNAGVRAALETALGHPVYVPPDPQFVVATGAALIAAGVGRSRR